MQKPPSPYLILGLSIIGLASIAVGLWLIHPAATFIGAGCFSMLLAYGMYRQSTQPKDK